MGGGRSASPQSRMQARLLTCNAVSFQEKISNVILKDVNSPKSRMQASLLTGNPVSFPEKVSSQTPTNATLVSIKIAGDGFGRKGAASHAKATRTKDTLDEGTASKQSKQNKRE